MCRRMTSNPNAAIWSYKNYSECTTHWARYNHNIVGLLFDLNLDHRFYSVHSFEISLALNLIFLVISKSTPIQFRKRWRNEKKTNRVYVVLNAVDVFVRWLLLLLLLFVHWISFAVCQVHDLNLFLCRRFWQRKQIRISIGPKNATWKHRVYPIFHQHIQSTRSTQFESINFSLNLICKLNVINCYMQLMDICFSIHRHLSRSVCRLYHVRNNFISAQYVIQLSRPKWTAPLQ